MAPMFPPLTSTLTVCAMDRRGRGASGDSLVYSRLSKEAEEVAAVVNARSGPVFVFGHSYGGAAALPGSKIVDRRVFMAFRGLQVLLNSCEFRP